MTARPDQASGPARPRASGVDGCPGGWIAFTVDDHNWSWTAIPLLQTGQLVDLAEIVGIDIPIGLPNTGPRACDLAARAMLGERRSTVFPAPLRTVLAAVDYRDACARARASGGPQPSIQCWNLVPRINAVDRVLAAGELDEHLVECHPEVCFTVLSGTPLLPKKTAEGQRTRLLALTEWLPDAATALATRPSRRAGTAPKGWSCSVDDALDAMVVAWSAQRWAMGAGTTLPSEPKLLRDSTGRLMRIIA